MVYSRCLIPGVLLAGALSACTSIPADWGRGDVAALAQARGRALPGTVAIDAFTREALSRPLSADVAVQIALVNNPRLRSETAQLGFAAAELYDAGRLANPVLSATRFGPNSGDAQAQLSLGIAVDFVNLLFLRANTQLAGRQFEAAKLAVAASVLELAADVEAAYLEAVAADQLAQMRELVAASAEASAALAQRYFEAGNINRRELALEQAAASQARLDALAGRAAAVEARSVLNRLMGLPAGHQAWTLEARLAEPLAEEDAVEALTALAAQSRLDVAAARANAEALAARFGLQRRSRLINGIEIGVEREEDFDGALHIGPTLALELPLFNWGGGRVAAAQAALMEAEAELDARVLDASNDVEREHARVLAAKARADAYRSALIPQREQVVEQMMLEHNYMLIGVFELIAAKQQEYEAYAGYLEAVRDYWLGRTALARAVGTRLPSSARSAAPTLDVQTLTQPRGAVVDHSGHHAAPPDDASSEDEAQDAKDHHHHHH